MADVLRDTLGTMPTSPLLSQVVETVLPALGSLLVALMSWLAITVQRKIKNEAAREMALRFSELAQDVVLEIEQTMVSSLRDAAQDGSISAEDAARAKREAVNKLKSHLGSKGKAEALKVLGLTEAQLEDFVATKIEAAVAHAKNIVGIKLKELGTIEEVTK